jgi:Holliday junction resolvase RusA-like endonuclease
MKTIEYPKQVIKGTCPSKSNSYRIGHRGLFKTKALTDYENNFFIQCNHYRNANIDGYFELYLDAYYPNQRSDLDGCFKIVLDILQKKVKAFVNDNKCVKIVANKFLDKEDPRIEFTIKEV